MSFSAEGTIEIDLTEFWTWVYKNYSPVPSGTDIQYGVPRVNKSNQTLEIDFAASDTCNPKEWFEPPKVIQQWKELT